MKNFYIPVNILKTCSEMQFHYLVIVQSFGMLLLMFVRQEQCSICSWGTFPPSTLGKTLMSIRLNALEIINFFTLGWGAGNISGSVWFQKLLFLKLSGGSFPSQV